MELVHIIIIHSSDLSLDRQIATFTLCYGCNNAMPIQKLEITRTGNESSLPAVNELTCVLRILWKMCFYYQVCAVMTSQ